MIFKKKIAIQPHTRIQHILFTVEQNSVARQQNFCSKKSRRIARAFTKKRTTLSKIENFILLNLYIILRQIF